MGLLYFTFYVKIQLIHLSTHTRTYLSKHQSLPIRDFPILRNVAVMILTTLHRFPVNTQHETHSTSMFLCTVPHNPALNRAVLKSPTAEHSAVPQHHNVTSTRRYERCYFNIRLFDSRKRCYVTPPQQVTTRFCAHFYL